MVNEKLGILQQKITTLKSEGKYQEVIENCYVLIELGKQLRDHKSILAAYMGLVASYFYIGDMEVAFSYIGIHKEICDKHGDEEDILLSSNVICLLYEYNKDLDKAKKILEKNINLGRKLKRYNIVSNGYSNYSHMCMLEEDYTKALEMANIRS